MNVKVIALWMCLCTASFAQGFAGLGQMADGFAVPHPDQPLTFPTDHGPHPEYRIEWWYLTANLTGPDGAEYGIQWTLFRTALAPEAGTGWSSPQLWLGHAGLTSARQHYYAERFGRGGIGQAGVSAAPFEAWIDNWSLSSRAVPDADAFSHLNVTATGDAFSYTLSLQTQAPLVRHGQNGFSIKSDDGHASYYYSQPFYEAVGTLIIEGAEVTVTGQAWLDREWSSQPLSETQSGWDWLSLHLDDGTRIMGFQLRQTDGGQYTSGTWITADGVATPLSGEDISLIPLETSVVAGRTVPTHWRVDLPARNMQLRTEPLNPASWMGTAISYWEGPIRISGTHTGRGYLEMTGY